MMRRRVFSAAYVAGCDKLLARVAKNCVRFQRADVPGWPTSSGRKASTLAFDRIKRCPQKQGTLLRSLCLDAEAFMLTTE